MNPTVAKWLEHAAAIGLVTAIGWALGNAPDFLGGSALFVILREGWAIAKPLLPL